MNIFIKMLLTGLLYFTILHAQYDVSLEEKSTYKDWGNSWGKVYIARNNIVTLAVVPDLGGRVMQYDLGEHAAIYVNDNVIGSLPADGNVLVGGFRMLPSPQADFGWPSPPEVDLKPYSCTVVTNNADSAVVYLESQVVDDPATKYQKHQGLKFKRRITLYKASTRVKVEMTMLNTGSTSMKHGIWDITQTNCSNNGNADPENIWVYFKKNPSSSMTDGFIEYPDQADGSGEEKAQWKPDAAEGGVMGVQFLQKVGKIGADCNAGWICHVDRLDGYAYVKTFTYEDGKTYPDGGASVQVYTYSNTTTPTVEVEVLGPIETLAQNDSVKMVENWFMARSHGPVLDVNDAGLITKRLTVKQVGTTLHADGTYGVFYPGTVYAELMDASDNVAGIIDSFSITPDDSLRFEKEFTPSQEAVKLQLTLRSADGEVIGVLDSGEIIPMKTVAEKADNLHSATVSCFLRNDVLRVTNTENATYTIELFSIDGQRITSLTNNQQRHMTLPLNSTGMNTLIVRITSDGKTFSGMIHNVHR